MVFKTHSVQETEKKAAELALSLYERQDSPRFIALDGDLGVGQTAFARGFTAALNPKASVKSPTFALVREYPNGDRSVYHFDMYRIGRGSLQHRVRRLSGKTRLLPRGVGGPHLICFSGSSASYHHQERPVRDGWAIHRNRRDRRHRRIICWFWLWIRPSKRQPSRSVRMKKSYRPFRSVPETDTARSCFP